MKTSIFAYFAFVAHSTQAMMINRLTPKPEHGFQVQLNLIVNEPFWSVFIVLCYF